MMSDTLFDTTYAAVRNIATMIGDQCAGVAGCPQYEVNQYRAATLSMIPMYDRYSSFELGDGLTQSEIPAETAEQIEGHLLDWMEENDRLYNSGKLGPCDFTSLTLILDYAVQSVVKSIAHMILADKSWFETGHDEPLYYDDEQYAAALKSLVPMLKCQIDGTVDVELTPPDGTDVDTFFESYLIALLLSNMLIESVK